jgi:hypothetical protein
MQAQTNHDYGLASKQKSPCNKIGYGTLLIIGGMLGINVCLDVGWAPYVVENQFPNEVIYPDHLAIQYKLAMLPSAAIIGGGVACVGYGIYEFCQPLAESFWENHQE